MEYKLIVYNTVFRSYRCGGPGDEANRAGFMAYINTLAEDGWVIKQMQLMDEGGVDIAFLMERTKR